MNNSYNYSYEKNIKWRVDGIDDASKFILEEYYKTYAILSRTTVCDAVRTICKITNKYAFAMLTYQDYQKVMNEIINGEGDTRKSLSENFFKYLYVFDLLSVPQGFEKCYWNKEKEIKIFNNKINRNKNSIKKKKEIAVFLSFDELERIIKFYDSVLSNDIINMKISFCFYALFFLGMPVEKLKVLSSEQIEDEYIITEDDEYILNDRFKKFLNQLSYKDFSFKQVNEYISRLGASVGVKELTPRKIKQANTQYTFTCSQCGEHRLSFSDNWSIVNNKIVCNDCATFLNKQYQLKKNEINKQLDNYEVESVTEQDKENINTLLSNFNDMKAKLTLPKNFEDINRFLKEIGDLGEKYVLEYERNKLRKQNCRYWEQVDGTYALDNSNGFDILSYTVNGRKIYIEVKTTTGDTNE